MEKKLPIIIKKQPDYTSCGPTALHSVYHYYDDKISLKNVLEEVGQFSDGGGTIAVVLGKHALARGYDVTICSYNIHIFDPTWFNLSPNEIKNNLKERYMKRQESTRLSFALKQYIDFLDLGGKFLFRDLSCELIHQILQQDIPILTGLSSTWLYQDPRENSSTNEKDPIGGDPTGHFIIISGHKDQHKFYIADPYHQNPIGNSNYYLIDSNRLINAILLGVSSYDGNLLLIKRR